MSDYNPISQNLDPCNCCEPPGGADWTKVSHFNRPGLPSITYRLGTHGLFLHRMLTRLPLQEIPSGPTKESRPLLKLKTRDTSDASIALLDAWACAADVLAFYQERIANEGFLRTATERLSILELASAIGYQLKPGVAASTYLAFTIEEAPGAPEKATIPVNTRVLSIPAQDQKPQTFETIEAVEARKEWNTLNPRLTQPQDLAAGTKILYLRGTGTDLQPGDALLLVGDERDRDPGSENWDFRYVLTVVTDTDNDQTIVTWRKGLGERPVAPAENPRVYAFQLRATMFGHNAAEWDNLHIKIKELYLNGNTDPDEWPSFNNLNNQIDLDAEYPSVIPRSWIALVRPNYVEIYKVREADFTTRTGFGLVSKITRIDPDGTENLNLFGRRETIVFAQSEELEIAEEPLPVEISGDEIALDRWIPGLLEERILIFSGQRMRVRASIPLSLRSPDGLRRITIQRGESLVVTAPPASEEEGTRWFLENRDGFSGTVLIKTRVLKLQPPHQDDEIVSEVAVISEIIEDQERIVLRLTADLQNLFDRTTLKIYGNVVPATHGETVTSEVLGSGDGSQINQRFNLMKPPLTYVPAATASGAESTMTVRINGVAWEEVPTLYGLDPRARSYIVRTDNEGKSQVIFGDSRSGARLSSGAENVIATYRSGIGLEGEVEAGSLTLMQTRPLGVSKVTNPLSASGAADPEGRDQARQNAPLTVLNLDRIVSLQDFEDFTRAFSSIGKAQATPLWNGETSVVHITAATASGESLDPDSILYSNLRQAIDANRDPFIPVVLQGYQPIHFRLNTKVLVDERYIQADVFEAVEAALLDAFSIEKHAFGEAVTAAEVTTLIQSMDGVIAADLDYLYRDGSPEALTQVLTASTARLVGSTYFPAELLLVHPFGIQLTEMIP